MRIDFVKTLEASAPYTPGTIYFESNTSLIKVATATNQYRVYGGVRNAEFDETTNILTIQNGNGDEVYIDFSTFTPNDASISIQKNGTTVGTFTTNQSTDVSINLQVNELPAVTASDNGKVLQVVNGVWALVTPVNIYTGDGEPSNLLGNNGDIYIQTQS